MDAFSFLKPGFHGLLGLGLSTRPTFFFLGLPFTLAIDTINSFVIQFRVEFS